MLREIEKLKRKLRAPESKNIKARSKYMKSSQFEKEEAPLKESIQVLETLEDEDLAEEEEVDTKLLKQLKTKRRSEPAN